MLQNLCYKLHLLRKAVFCLRSNDWQVSRLATMNHYLPSVFVADSGYHTTARSCEHL